MDPLPIPRELLIDIFLRLRNPADLIRASAASVSFRRLVADRSFLRQYRKLHPPPLLGFFVEKRKLFYPAAPPHPSALAAASVALAADFSFLPAPGSGWLVQDCGVRPLALTMPPASPNPCPPNRYGGAATPDKTSPPRSARPSSPLLTATAKQKIRDVIQRGLDGAVQN
jgi:hypothetical protein